MGRWRSGAPLVLAPEQDDPELGADPMRNNDFNYKEMDPFGYACPLGSHARRLNPRDTAHYMNRRRMIRRGATYGPALPEGAPDDGVDRGIAAFIICADLVRQFEFAQNVWINDKTIPRTRQRARPDLRHPGRHVGFHRPEAADPQGAQGYSGVHHALGRRVLLPARDERAALPRLARQLKGSTMSTLPPPRTYNQNHVPRAHTGGRRISIYWTWSYPWEAQRDPAIDGEPLLHDDRGAQRAVARATRRRSTTRPTSCRASRARWSCSTAPPWPSRSSPARPPVTRSPSTSASTRPATSCRSTNGSWPTPTR